MKTPREQYYDVERIIEFDLVRATEAAALNSFQWLGRGERDKADAAACDGIRGMFDLMDICGEVVVGEGSKDPASGIFKGEHLGTWNAGTLKLNLAIDPIDGSRNVARGILNSISCIVAARPEDGVAQTFRRVPSAYMRKLAYGPDVARKIERSGVEGVSVRHSVEDTITAVATALRKRIRDVVVLVIERPRHEKLIEQIRATGAVMRMVGDGDIAATIAPSIPDSGIDLYLGTGGSSEAVMAAAGIRCLGGEIQCMMWPKDEEEHKKLVDQGFSEDLNKVFYSNDLATGNNIIFCATGISDSPMVKGVRVRQNVAVTHSILMRAKSGTIREMSTSHDVRRKTIHLRSDRREHTL